AGPLPVQCSAASHAPAAGRHSCPAARSLHAAVQHDPLVPFAVPSSHSSPRSTLPLPHAQAPEGGCVPPPPIPSPTAFVHASASGVHGASAGWRRSSGQVGLVPVQDSGTSHSPAAARHTVPALPAECWQPRTGSQLSTVQPL